jgi:ADP-ribose pyrophosphatase YjhB (NUDIX family)
MIQRKDSICYIEIIRGKYTLKTLNILINRISNQELNDIKTKSFDELWKKLWLLDSIQDTKYMREYERSKLLFETIDKSKLKSTKYEETEWEIPKGKKNKRELNYVSAKRELEEETNIKPNDYELIINISPLVEEFRGENDVNYRNIYYIGICKNKENVKLNLDNRQQILEIKNVEMYDRETAKSKIRDYNLSKIEIIDKIFDFIEKNNNNII